MTTNNQFLQAGCPSRRPNNSVKALKGSQLRSKLENRIEVLLVEGHRSKNVSYFLFVCNLMCPLIPPPPSILTAMFQVNLG